MRGFVILTLMLPLTVTPAYAGEPAKPDKVVCRSSRVLGSNFSQRVCKTSAQWDDEKKRAREYLDTTRPVPVPNPTRGT